MALLCDMHGNAWEWCRDVYFWKLPGGRDPEVRVNPDEESKVVYRVVRGGCWLGPPEFCRSGMRSGYEQIHEQNHGDARHNFHGFRVALGAVQPVK